MVTIIDRQTHTVDASNKSLGRLAVEVANLLRGKLKTDFAPHKDIGDFVVVEHITNANITGKKMEQKAFYHHSGYPGGLKKKMLGDSFEKQPGEVFRKAVWGMMPKNKLRSSQIRRLKIET